MQTSINELVTEVKQATDYQINKKILREKSKPIYTCLLIMVYSK